jgi:hypothetical protein
MKIQVGSVVTGKSGKLRLVVAIHDDGLELEDADGRWKVRHSAITQVLSHPAMSVIQVGDRLRRLRARQTSYPVTWFGKDSTGQLRPDFRPSLTEIEVTAIAFTRSGFKTRTDDGRIFHVSQEAIDLGEWVQVSGQSN